MRHEGTMNKEAMKPFHGLRLRQDASDGYRIEMTVRNVRACVHARTLVCLQSAQVGLVSLSGWQCFFDLP